MSNATTNDANAELQARLQTLVGDEGASKLVAAFVKIRDRFATALDSLHNESVREAIDTLAAVAVPEANEEEANKAVEARDMLMTGIVMSSICDLLSLAAHDALHIQVPADEFIGHALRHFEKERSKKADRARRAFLTGILGGLEDLPEAPPAEAPPASTPVN